MNNPWLAVTLVLFLWWFLTGAILFLVKWADNKGEKFHKFLALSLLPFLVIGFYGFLYTLNNYSVIDVYIAFVSALTIWGWFELAFLTGIITGPNDLERPANVHGFERFKLAWRTVAYSEIVLLAVFLVLLVVSIGHQNLFGFFTFFVLYFCRLSAKINLFFGVPKINTEFLPAPVRHLASHFRISTPSLFYPVSILILLLMAAFWLQNCMANTGHQVELIGFSFLLALTVLALFEHWFMVLAIPDAALWRWMLPKPRTK